MGDLDNDGTVILIYFALMDTDIADIQHVQNTIKYNIYILSIESKNTLYSMKGAIMDHINVQEKAEKQKQLNMLKLEKQKKKRERLIKKL